MKAKHPRHDGYFKHSMSKEKIRQSIIKCLPAEQVKHMDLSKIRVESETLVGKQLDRKTVDVLLSVPYKGHRALVYILIEHQSTVQEMMPLRLMCYVFYILERWLAAEKERRRQTPRMGPIKLPTIFPIIYYNGEAAYHGPLTLAELFEDPETFTQMIKGPMQVIDTGVMDTARFEAEANAYVFHTLMKNIFSPELKRILLDLLPYIRQIEISGDVDFVVRSFKYLIDSARTNQEDLFEVIENLSSSRGEIMTIMETWTAQIHEYKQTIAEFERKQAEARREKAEAERRAMEREQEAERRAMIAEREKAEAEREKAEAERKKAEAERKAICKLLGQGMDEAIIANCLDVPVSQVQNIKAEMA